MSSRVVWTEQARADLFDACEHLAGSNLQAALALSRDVEAATDRLAKAPNRGRYVPELEGTPNAKTFRELIVRHLRVVYVSSKRAVMIHCVFDSPRDLEEILTGRLLR